MPTIISGAGLSARLARMRERTIGALPEISLVRAQAVTDAARAHPEEPRTVQLALGVRDTLAQLPIRIGGDEQIVGALTEKARGAVVYPELKSDFLLKELDNFGEREHSRFIITDAEKWQLREEILPFWLGASAYDDMLARQPEAVLFGMRNVAYVVQNDFSGANHLSHVDYGRVLQRGLTAIARQARAAGAAGVDPEARGCYRAVAISADAIAAFARRYAVLAREQAGRTASPQRARELAAIAAVMDRVPAEPARTFREAVQAYWITVLALMQLDGGAELPLGRLDQVLSDFYARDLAAGRLTREAAQELLTELFLKINALEYLAEYASTRVNDGNRYRLTLTLSGVDRAGHDATNEVSALLLDTFAAVHLTLPNAAVRLHAGTPAAFRRRVLEMVTDGSNLVQTFNDEVIIAGFERLGIPAAATRDYVVTGCVQPIPAGGYGPTCSAFVNGPKALEMALNGGSPFVSLSGEDEDRPPPPVASYRELWDLVKAQLRTNTLQALAALEVVGEVQHRLLPNPVLSMLIDGALEVGRDVKAGGARFNLAGVDLIGLGTLVDSMAALRELVFERGAYSLAEVVEWLKADFEGYEPQRQTLLRRAPKFGNDDPRADAIAAEVVEWMEQILGERRPYRGGAYTLGLHSETHHIMQGVAVGATPDGRHSGEMLSPGCGPTSGMDQAGPTASLTSIAAAGHTKVMGGASANMRFSPALLRTQEQRDRFGALLDGYFRLGGQHLQINVVDTATLRDAQQHPERYADLIVRVTGYSARFVDLAPGTQEEIIRRSEMRACS